MDIMILLRLNMFIEISFSIRASKKLKKTSKTMPKSLRQFSFGIPWAEINRG